MIDLYYWPTPNGHEVTIFLEETGLEYEIVPGEYPQRRARFAPEFLKFSPEQPDARDHRPQRPGREAARAVRVGRDPALPAEKPARSSTAPGNSSAAETAT
jgi:hypothetical protein